MKIMIAMILALSLTLTVLSAGAFDAPAGTYTCHLLKVPAGCEKDSTEYRKLLGNLLQSLQGGAA